MFSNFGKVWNPISLFFDWRKFLLWDFRSSKENELGWMLARSVGTFHSMSRFPKQLKFWISYKNHFKTVKSSMDNLTHHINILYLRGWSLLLPCRLWIRLEIYWFVEELNEKWPVLLKSLILPKLMIGMRGISIDGNLANSAFGISTVHISSIGYMLVLRLSE